jgi:hypothetical protein
MRFVTAAVFALLSGPSLACSWAGISRDNVTAVLSARLGNSDEVVHARVVSVRPLPPDREVDAPAVAVRLEKQEATLEVIRSFKGGSGQLKVIGYTDMCGYQFTVGEENVYFISKGHVGVPDVEPASGWLLSALERATKATPNKSLERTRAR